MSAEDFVLKLQSITKRYGGVVALDNVEFVLERGKIHCLVGENGSGKSTLIKIIAGVVQPEAGAQITVDGERVLKMLPSESISKGIQVIYQDLSLFPNLTVAENIAGMQSQRSLFVNWRSLRQKAQEVLAKMAVTLDLDSIVGNLSIADRQLVAIARALAFEAKIVIMDEPTASLTRTEVDSLFKVVHDLVRKGITILFVSHRIDEIMEIAQIVTILRDGRLIEVIPVSRLDDQKLARLMTGQELVEELVPASSVSSEILLEVKGLSKKGNYKDINFTVHKGEVLGITGLLGSGRSELALSLFGMNRPDRGEILLEGRQLEFESNRDAIKAGIAYVPEDRILQGLIMPQSVVNNMTLTTLDKFLLGSGLLDSTARKEESAEWVRELGVKTAQLESPVATLSGGNQQKVVLAKWMGTNPKLLILDSPTSGVDIAAKNGIYALIHELVAGGIAVILISDEAAEVLPNSHRVLIMRRGRILEEIDPLQCGIKELNERIHVKTS